MFQRYAIALAQAKASVYQNLSGVIQKFTKWNLTNHIFLIFIKRNH